MIKHIKKNLRIYVWVLLVISLLIIALCYFYSLDYRLMIRYVYTVILLVTVFFMFMVVVLENRSPNKTLSWILVLLFLPVVGIVLYLLFGRNFRKRKMFNEKEFADYKRIRMVYDAKLLEEHNRVEQETDIPIINNLVILLNNNSKALLTFYNEIVIYTEGAQAFSAFFDAIKNAESYIHLEFFSVNNDSTGKELKELLIEKASEGIDISFLVDSVGSWTLMFGFLKELKNNEIKIGKFLKVKFPLISSKLNYRNHRKILIVDGKIGFMGGINIGDKYTSKSRYYGYWRDTHIRLEGEAVHSLEVIFCTDWLFATGENLFCKNYFSPVVTKKYNPAQIITSGPDSDWESIMQAYFTMITSASIKINITSPYLVLNESLLTAIKTASLRGVEVKIIVPQKPDHHIVFWASRSYFTELLEAGVKIFEYQNGFIHSKTISIDGVVVSIGTANMDVRSFYQNFEVNGIFYGSEISKKFDRIFDFDLMNSREIRLDDHNSRSGLEKFKESFCRLFSPVL